MGLFCWSSGIGIESPEIVVVVVVSAIAKFLEVFDFGQNEREITRTNGERDNSQLLQLLSQPLLFGLQTTQEM
ncbi:hypothetical protein H5410_054968 [Solanum commersonii]|uniref:Uncharacterized protein n=1 Tax=Solanum commersonii TaxID=4109 RepID=A0A9J5WGU4_SOLCO|nr:hypothetical protein H5410_054968 [Solanum commersonii]